MTLVPGNFWRIQLTIHNEITHAFAQTGKLRVVINVGNPILARIGAGDGPEGVSVDLAGALAARLQVPVEHHVVKTAQEAVNAVAEGTADIGFFAIDPLRGADIHFTAPYVLIEGSYLVRAASPIQSNDEVDRSGHVVVVGKGSAYDLFLTRELKHAEISRAPSSPEVVDFFIEHKADVAAGVRQQLEKDAANAPGLRLLDGRFMVIRQAMGVAKVRGSAAAEFLDHFVEDMKAGGLVDQALEKHHIEGVTVAPH